MKRKFTLNGDVTGVKYKEYLTIIKFIEVINTKESNN